MTFDHIPLPAHKIRSHSPAHHPGFLALSSEMNTLSKNKLAKMNWHRMHLLCQRIFKQEGCDLWTGVWYCYINTKQQGWSGLAFATEQLVATLYHLPAVDKYDAHSALKWLSHHIGDVLYSLPDSPGNIIAMQRSIKGFKNLTLLAEKNGMSLSFNAMVSYINHKARLGKNDSLASVSVTSPFIVEMTTENSVQAHHGDREDHEFKLSFEKKRSRISPGLLVLCSILMFILVLVSYQYVVREDPMALQLFRSIEKLERKAEVLDLEKLKSDYASNQRVKDLFDETRRKKPEWLMALPILKDLAAAHPINEEHSVDKYISWQQIQHQLDNLESRLLASEKGTQKHLTISELKTEIYEIRRKLRVMEMPVEVIAESMQVNNNLPGSDGGIVEDKIKDLLSQYYSF